MTSERVREQAERVVVLGASRDLLAPPASLVRRRRSTQRQRAHPATVCGSSKIYLAASPTPCCANSYRSLAYPYYLLLG